MEVNRRVVITVNKGICIFPITKAHTLISSVMLYADDILR